MRFKIKRKEDLPRLMAFMVEEGIPFSVEAEEAKKPGVDLTPQRRNGSFGDVPHLGHDALQVRRRTPTGKTSKIKTPAEVLDQRRRSMNWLISEFGSDDMATVSAWTDQIMTYGTNPLKHSFACDLAARGWNNVDIGNVLNLSGTTVGRIVGGQIGPNGEKLGEDNAQG